MPADDERLDIGALETWLWDAACAIRGATDAPKFKDFILPLVFYKRLSDVFDDEFAGCITEYGDEEAARAIIELITPMRCAWGASRSCASTSPASMAGASCARIPPMAVWASSPPTPCAPPRFSTE
jgi:hypothetical protein